MGANDKGLTDSQMNERLNDIHRMLQRRAFLRSSAACGAWATLPGAGLISALPLSARKASGARGVRRVIMVAFSGGVRTKETLGAPDNVSTLMRMASEGVVYPRARTSNLGHFGATLSLFTGVSKARGIRENSPGDNPTVFEYVRKGLGLPADEVWISTSGGAQQANFAYSLHRDYGPAFGANAVDGEGLFNSEFRKILSRHGGIRAFPEREREQLERMRQAMGLGPEDKGLPLTTNTDRVERYLLDELNSGTSNLRGVGASDAKALRVARNLIGVFKPTFLGVALQDSDVAHGDFNAYVNVIRRNDMLLGELWEAVKSDPELAESTAIFVLPEFGRDADLNSRRGLDHGDGSDDLNYVSIVAWGPGFGRGVSVRSEVRTIDVCATACSLLGVNARLARGRRLPRLMG